MQKIITLQSKLKKMIIGIMLAFVVLLALMFYFFAENQINGKYENEAKSVINYTHLLLSKTFQDAERGLETVANHAADQLDYASFLNVVYETVESASTIYISDVQGNFYLYPKRFVAEDFDPRNRAWYFNAVGKPGEILWSEPYIDHGTGEFTVSASRTLMLKNKTTGVVGVDLLLNELKTVVDEAQIGDKGFVTVVNGDGIIISHKDLDLLARNADETEIFDLPLKNIISESTKVDGVNQIFYVEAFEKGNLYLIATVYKSDIYRSLFIIYFIVMGIVLLVILVGEKIAVRYAKKITKPVYELRKVMEKAADGDYDVICKEKSDDEIGILIEGFNQMIQSIYENKSEMQSLYEELYASEETLKEQYDQLFENREFIKQSEERYKMIFDASKEGLWDCDSNWYTTYLTPAWYDQFGFNAWDVRMKQWKNMIVPEDRDMVDYELNAHLSGEKDVYHTEYRIITKQGQTVWIEVIGKARFDEHNNFIGMSGSHTDISLRKNYELKMREMAYRDNLTSLYNRRYFDEQLDLFIAKGGKGTLLFVDINNFKYINDIYGHVFGDEVLIELSNRVENLFKEDAKYLTARFSGDEFIILVKNIVEHDEIIFILNSLNKEIERAIQRGKKYFKLTASIGVISFPNDGKERIELLQNADIAMYHAKRVSKKPYYFFDDDIRIKAIQEMEIENHLREAIVQNEFEVFYQPIYTNETNEIETFEALVRWNSSKLGFVYPNMFIPIAEKTGLINEIGMIVLEKACNFMAQLNQKMNKLYSISVNISVVQLLEENFASRVISIIKESGLSNNLVTLEITESMMMENNENILAKLYYLRNSQIGISLDDFGTGYSSFNNLIKLPLTCIKLDRSIMKDSITNEHVFNLLESVVSFAHKIGVKVVAEGIEDERYLEKSEAMGIDYLQGYYFSRPVDEKQIIYIVENCTK